MERSRLCCIETNTAHCIKQKVNTMNKTLHKILEELDSRLADSIDKLEEITPNLENDSEAFTADPGWW